GLDVLLEGWTPEQADLRDVRRAVARQAALALDRFNHRRLLAADVRACAAAQMQLGVRRKSRLLHLLDFIQQHQTYFGIFVADVDVCFLCLDDPSGNEHALNETMWVTFEIVAILERARFALIGIDREHARRRLGAHERPFSSGRKSRTAEST